MSNLSNHRCSTFSFGFLKTFIQETLIEHCNLQIRVVEVHKLVTKDRDCFCFEDQSGTPCFRQGVIQNNQNIVMFSAAFRRLNLYTIKGGNLELKSSSGLV